MKYLLFILIIVPTQYTFSLGDCSCKEELRYVVDYYERNLPGFVDNVTPNNIKQYNELKRNLFKRSKAKLNKVECFKVLTYYVEFFKDNHSKITMSFPAIDENDDESVSKFLNSEIYSSREFYSISENDLKQYPITELRGIYQTKDETYTIAVIPNKNIFRDYIGVVIDSKTKLWKPGQIKLEIKLKENGTMEAFQYQRNHSLKFYNKFYFKEGILGDIWLKKNKENFNNYALDKNTNFEFKILQDTIAYLSIPTFSSYYSAKIDSLYEAVENKIDSKPYLIIDVRNNGGGNDDNASPLLKYIYTKPFYNDKVDLYVTEDNLKVWENWYKEAKKDSLNFSKEDLKWFENEILKMKTAKLNSFITRSEVEKYKQKIYKNGPKKVALLYNRNCASTCESLVFWAMESDKTILVGENSGGFVGYGEVGTIKTPCFDYDLFCTMTRYENQRKYETYGIPPTHLLDNKSDWIEQTIKIMSREAMPLKN